MGCETFSILLEFIEKVHLHCPGIGRITSDWVAVSASVLYGASANAYTGKTRLSI